MATGARRLLRLSIPSPMKTVERGLDPRSRLLLSSNPDGPLSALLDDCADAATDLLAPVPVWTRAEFTALRDRAAQSLAATTLDIVRRVEKVVQAWSGLQVALPAKRLRRNRKRLPTCATSSTGCWMRGLSRRPERRA